MIVALARLHTFTGLYVAFGFMLIRFIVLYFHICLLLGRLFFIVQRSGIALFLLFIYAKVKSPPASYPAGDIAYLLQSHF